MRSLFIVGSKILGLLFLYWSLITLVGLIMSIKNIDVFGSSIILTTVFSFLISVIFAGLLLLRSDAIADYLRLQEDKLVTIDLSFDSIFKLGVILVGIYVFATKIGTFLKILFHYIGKIKGPRSVFAPHWISTSEGIISTFDVIMQALVIVFSLLLVFESTRVINIIKRFERRGT